MYRKSQCSSPALSRNHRLFWGLRSNGAIVGFAELAVRADVAGLEGKRVGYVEGLYVILEARQQGLARRLLQASRNWARQQKCAAFASDRAGRVVVDRSF